MTIGTASALWVILRTGTKPSRIDYPCQRVARSNVKLAIAPILLNAIPVALALKKIVERNCERILLLVLLVSVTLVFPFQIFVVGPVQSVASCDINHDGMMDVYDLAVLGKVYNSTPESLSWNPDCDLNSDGVINASDLGIFREYFGMPTISEVFVVSNISYTESIGNVYPAISKLFLMMEQQGLYVYELIQPDDVVIIKVNCQWQYRGGTNTDLVKVLIQKILEHPQGWIGEIVIADNGQTNNGGGSLDWEESNSFDHTQSMQDVANHFSGLGYNVSAYEWTHIKSNIVSEYEENDFDDGYVTVPIYYEGHPCSYPKFTTTYGTYISLHKGIWLDGAYDEDKLKIINVPVLKTHSTYGVTSAVKHYMGVVSQPISNTHSYIEDGAMGDILHLAYPTLNIIDAIFVNPEPWKGPMTYYEGSGEHSDGGTAVYAGVLIAGIDPIATDYVGSKDVLMQVAENEGYDPSSMNPDQDVGEQSNWRYRQYLVASHNKLLSYGYTVTINPNLITVITDEM